jgi:hypothetical protein
MAGMIVFGTIWLIAVAALTWGIQSLVNGEGFGVRVLGVLLIILAVSAVMFLFFGLPMIYAMWLK